MSNETVKPTEPAAAPSVDTQAAAVTAPASEETKVSDSGKQPEAPVAYELKLPEGSPLDKAKVDEIVAFAKEHKISPEVAQKILERDSNAIANYEKAQSEAFSQQSKKWVDQIQSDKEMGGVEFKNSVEIAHRVMKRFGSPEFGQELERSGLGNHPELLRLAYRVGKELKIMDDKFVDAPRGAANLDKSTQEVLYPDLYKQ